ncbi:MAG: AAA family ATPase [Nanoarchaeota archaeon]|nr:AAA family ATPase [Nanoarchaeota archaeon]MBU1623021.1 AAA family ATPase [Nanoarchaeota archaeon]MBU1974261.1 AAA family ATPase [Nanoarchaeota archaeon]
MNKIVCLVGMCGSGKSVVADVLIEKGYQFCRFGQITLDLVKERGLEPTEENEKKIREGVRKEHGMGAFATLNIPKFDKLLEKGNLVADGLYSWTEYKILKEYYKERMFVVALIVPAKDRYDRLVARTEIDEQMRNRPMTKEQAQARDYAEIENIEKGGPIAMADYYILNISSLEELKQAAEKLSGWVERR